MPARRRLGPCPAARSTRPCGPRSMPGRCPESWRWQQQQMPRSVLMFDPNDRWAYGGSLDRVGRLVEIAGGKTLDRYFRDHILLPLGMNDTGFEMTERQRTREASLHVRSDDGKLVPQPREK